MITAYSGGLLTIWWPRWKQFTLLLRWLLPIVMHVSQLSLVNWVASSRRSIEPDTASTIFVTSASLALLRFKDLTVEPYKPSLRYFDSFVQVVLQIIYVDLSVRFILIPISYFLYYFCSGGYVTPFILCLQLHLLSSKYEVMGFLGGHRSKSLGRDKISLTLTLTQYRPCRTAVQSGTMSEMCPVSQVEQSSKLGEEGYEVLGWFHSHPLFPANPSRTDLRTQKEMQNQFAFDNDRPFIGLILSGLNMAFKCIYLMPRQSNFDDDFLLYEIDADIIKDYTNFKVYVRDVLDIIEENCDSTSDLIKKFKSSSSTILRQYGFKNDSFFLDIL